MNLKPLSNRVVIRRDTSDDKSKGGIIIPDAAKQKPARGKVVAVGPGKFHPELGSEGAMYLRVGDVVLFGQWSGNEVPGEDKDLVIMSEDDVLAVIG